MRRASPRAISAAALALLGWALMTLGAFVRASESGLGCPDWPACHGRLLAHGGHALIEQAHRWVAAALIVGLLGLALTVLPADWRERRLRVAVLLALALVVLQAVLGGVTVLLENVSWTVVAHYGGAALLLAAITLLAVRLALPDAGPAPRDSFSRLVASLAAVCLALLLAGSTVANTDSTSACGLPLCRTALLASLDHHAVIAIVHRLLALALLALALWTLSRSRRERRGVVAIERAAAAVAILSLLQAGLGIAVVAIGQSAAVEVAHSSLGSLTWLAVTVLLWLTRTLPASRGGRAASPGASRLQATSTSMSCATQPGSGKSSQHIASRISFSTPVSRM